MAIAADTKPLSRRQEIYDWLNKQAENLGIEATLLTHRANMSDGRLYLLVHIANALDVYDEVTKLQELESSWNYQEPSPRPLIFLLPAEEADKPSWIETYAPVQEAIDRYDDAFETFRAAQNSKDAELALQDMKLAKAAELEAAREMDRAA